MADTPSLRLPAAARAACNNAIVVSGCARSGTTLVGQLLHSMEGVEYSFEDPALVSLFATIDSIPQEQWMLLYETSLYMDVLLNALTGRRLNCNRADDSSIFKTKDAALVEARLASSKSMRSAVQEAVSSVVAYKVPDLVPALPRLASYYPGARFVLVYRNPEDTLSSLLAKGWFSDAALNEGAAFWPNRQQGNALVPHWVPAAEVPVWLAYDELHRAAYYYVCMVNAFAAVPKAIFIDYDALVAQPEQTAASLAGRLGLSFGSKTRGLIATIAPRARRHTTLLERLDDGLLLKIRNLAEWQRTRDSSGQTATAGRP